MLELHVVRLEQCEQRLVERRGIQLRLVPCVHATRVALLPFGDEVAAIEALAVDRRRSLVVQRTGWGKSAVYFVATLLLRSEGAGPTVIVSPLLALMRNQIAAAERAGTIGYEILTSLKGRYQRNYVNSAETAI